MCERCGCGSMEIAARRSTAPDELLHPWCAAEAGTGGAAQPRTQELGAAAALALASASVTPPSFLISVHSALAVSLLPRRALHEARWGSVAGPSGAHSAVGWEPAEARTLATSCHHGGSQDPAHRPQLVFCAVLSLLRKMRQLQAKGTWNAELCPWSTSMVSTEYQESHPGMSPEGFFYGQVFWP